MTRIAISTADQLLNRMDNGIIYTTTGGSTGVIGAGPQEQLPTTVLQYEKDVEDKHQPQQQQQQQHHGHAHAAHQPQTIYAAAGAAPDQAGQTKQIVYALGGGEPKNVIYGDPKAAMPHFEAVPGAGSGTGSGGPGSVEEEKPQIDYVYNEGNKTVIYTDQKGLESLYANNELGLMDGTQIVVQSNLYTQQQGPDGTTVYVVASDMNPEDINGLQQSRPRVRPYKAASAGSLSKDSFALPLAIRPRCESHSTLCLGLNAPSGTSILTRPMLFV
uniref:Uncharacterized protein n=1 Tax=Anopheles melas TaxID=34690 RepID=A0A182TQH0_9DIPT